MTTEIVNKDSSIFRLLDKEDERQIVNLKDFRKDSILLYKVKDNYELSYRGIKHLAILMADKGMPLSIVRSDTILSGNGNEKTWYATVLMCNEKTGQKMEGVSQCPFYDEKGQDHFARTKAHSKAERNAIRKLIPEYLITQFIKDAEEQGKIKKLDFCSCNKPVPNPLANEICKTCNKVIKQ